MRAKNEGTESMQIGIERRTQLADSLLNVWLYEFLKACSLYCKGSVMFLICSI